VQELLGPRQAMADGRHTTVQMVVTRAPEFLPVVQGFVDQLAQQMSFDQGRRLNLKQGILQACRRMMEPGEGGGSEDIALEFLGFSDRLEIVVESGAGVPAATEADAFLLNQLMDRVSVEETDEGGQRIMLVKYSERGSQP
jgi:hypothetical protein